MAADLTPFHFEYDTLLAAYTAGKSAQPMPTQSAAVTEAADDDMDLFADEDESPNSLKEQMAAKMAKQQETAPAAKKEKKPVIAKSSVTLEAMPADGEVDITGMYDSHIKKLEIDGLVWGPTAKVVNGPFGLKKLSFGCAIEDAKVNLEQIEEAVETLCMSSADAENYLELRRNGDLDDYEEEWANKPIGSVKVTSFQKI